MVTSTGARSPEPAEPLRGQVAVITGGNGGIGLGIANGLARAGADVAIWARNEGKSQAAVDRLRALHPGVAVEAFPCDVADPEGVAAALAATLTRFGRLDACVANAGVHGVGSVLDLTLDEWRQVTAINLDGVFVTLQAAARQMVAQGTGGALVAVASTSAFHGAPLSAHYAASKAGVLALVRSMAVALARHQIRVNSLVPGWTTSEMGDVTQQSARLVDATVARTPVRRWATPEEYEAVGVYLCDKSQTFHTGDAVVVDGGYTVF